jgi:type I restriction enzyme R subunit
MPPRPDPSESEWRTRKGCIDPRLDARGWRRAAGNPAPLYGPFRTDEERTDHGPADYVLWLDRRPRAVVEAKRLGLGTQEVLSQAERYARGLKTSRTTTMV